MGTVRLPKILVLTIDDSMSAQAWARAHLDLLLKGAGALGCKQPAVTVGERDRLPSAGRHAGVGLSQPRPSLDHAT